MSWALIADSSCNLRGYVPSAPDCSFAIAPLKIEIAGQEYIDDEYLDVDDLNRRVAEEKSASGSACPSAGEWAELFRSADNVIAITISSNLSGSYEAALMGRTIVMDEHVRDHAGSIEGKNIQVLDSKAAGGPLEVAILLIDRYLTDNPTTSFEQVVKYAQQIIEHSQVLFSLSSYENLVKNGRMPKLVGSVASSLSIRMLGTASPQGTIKVVAPTRGDKKTDRKIIECMAADGFHGGMVYIDHVDNAKGASHLRDAIINTWPTAEVHIIPCGGLCSYYAEQTGLIVGYEML